VLTSLVITLATTMVNDENATPPYLFYCAALSRALELVLSTRMLPMIGLRSSQNAACYVFGLDRKTFYGPIRDRLLGLLAHMCASKLGWKDMVCIPCRHLGIPANDIGQDFTGRRSVQWPYVAA